MPRAPQFNFSDSADLSVCRSFVADAMATSFDVTLKLNDAGLLHNEKSGTTYCVVPSFAEEGRLRAVMAKDTCPLFKQRPTYLALLDVARSRVHLFDTESLRPAMAQAIGQPHAGMMAFNHQDHLDVRVQIDWATHSGLIKKSFDARKEGEEFTFARDSARAGAEQFVHLHNHSTYSLLDGTSTIEGMVRRAVLNGQPGLALTDHGMMFGTWKFYKECKEYGIKPILGCEIYLVDDVKQRYQHEGKDRRFEYHTTVLAMNQTGWENLCSLVSEACRDHYYYVPRIDHEMLFKRNEGLIVLSGCFKGPVAWHLQQFEQPADGSQLPHWYKTDPDRSRSIMRRYRQAFGDRYYVEIQSIDFQRYMRAIPSIAQLARDEGIPAVVTNDNHYELGEDAAFQAMMTRISSSKVDEIGDLTGRVGCYYIKSRTEIDPVGILQPDMFDRSCEIMERCKLEFPKGFLFPRYPHEQDVDWPAYLASKQQQTAGVAA
jgi:hypothetical protein